MTNDYYLVFQERSGNHGKTFKEVVQKQAQHDFKYFLQSSPNSIQVNINSKDGRKFLIDEEPNEIVNAVFSIWGDKPTIVFS